MKNKDVMYFHIILALFFIIIGSCLDNFLFENIKSIKENFMNISNKQRINPGVMFFFINNIKFFLLISILPFIGTIFFSIQFLTIGSTINQVIKFPFLYGFNLLYRHLIFEIIALFISIIISYKYWKCSKKILKDISINWKKEVLVLSIMYLIIILCTLIGAILEGTAVVIN